MNHAPTPEHPSAAGMYDHYLGGTAHSPVDAAAAQQGLQLVPELTDAALANRGFLQRVVKRMAGELGIRQFLDLGSGLPTERNTHDLVTEAVPDGRVVYVDIDPAVVARTSEILDDTSRAAAFRADIRQPGTILEHPQTRRLINFREPVGLLLVAVLHFVPDDDDPWGMVERYVDAVPSGSYLALSHGQVGDHLPERVRDALIRIYSTSTTPVTDRSKTEIERLLKGLEIVPPYPGADPDLVYVGTWGADDPAAADSEGSRMMYAALARRP